MTDPHNNTPAKKTFSPNGMATLIGSIPLTDHGQAMEWIAEYTPNIPLWPQLPCIREEGMLRQFIEGFPGIVDTEKQTGFNTETAGFSEEMLAFFEEYLAVSEHPGRIFTSRFAVSKERGAGLYLLKETVKGKEQTKAIKGQITGPFTLLTGLKDQNNRDGYYDPTIREIVVKGLAMKAAWQVTFLADIGLPVILFIDEPALAGLGSSSFVTVSKDDINQDQTEMITAIHQAGGLAGIHVCANTDWPLLLSLDFDIINFDAYGYFDKIITCRDQLHEFLKRGAFIAWGIVPTSETEAIQKESAQSLADLWENQAKSLSNSNWDVSAILKQSLITPSCGTGSLSPEMAERVLMLTRDVSEILRNKYL